MKLVSVGVVSSGPPKMQISSVAGTTTKFSVLWPPCWIATGFAGSPGRFHVCGPIPAVQGCRCQLGPSVNDTEIGTLPQVTGIAKRSQWLRTDVPLRLPLPPQRVLPWAGKPLRGAKRSFSLDAKL